MRHAMIFAAGLGTRLRPLTNDRPKALVEVKGIPLLALQLKRLQQLGFTNVTVNVHHFAEKVITFLQSKDWGMDIHISDESSLLRDTGGGLRKALPFFEEEEAIFVINVDVLSDLDPQLLYDKLKNSKALAVLGLRERKTSRYLLFDEEMYLQGWENQQTGEVKGFKNESSQTYAFSGIQVIQTALIRQMPSDRPFSIIDTYLAHANSRSILGHLQKEGIWLDVGKPAELAQAEFLLPKLNVSEF